MDDNSESVKVDSKIRTLGDKAYDSNVAGSLQSLSIADQWIEVDFSYFSYTSTKELAVSTIEADVVFQVGDKVWIQQSGTDKYFFVINRTSTSITLFGGTDYTIANASIDKFAFSRLPKPVGHPNLFNYTPVPYDQDFNAYSSNTSKGIITMVGNLVVDIVGISATMTSATGNIGLYIKSPFTGSAVGEDFYALPISSFSTVQGGLLVRAQHPLGGTRIGLQAMTLPVTSNPPYSTSDFGLWYTCETDGTFLTASTNLTVQFTLPYLIRTT